LQKNQSLATLLNDISVGLETGRKRIKDILKDLEDTHPTTPTVPIKSLCKQLRQASSFDKEDDNSPTSEEAQVAASVDFIDSIEDLDFLEEDPLQNKGSETCYTYRNAKLQCLRSLKRKLRQPEEEGYVPWRQLMTVKEEDFNRIGFKLGRRRKLQRLIATMDGYPQSEPLPSYGVRTVQANSTLVTNMLSFSNHYKDCSMRPLTKESKQPQNCLHSDVHRSKRAITWALNDPSSPQGAMRRKPIQLSIEERHLTKPWEFIEVKSLPVRVNATIEPNLPILGCLARSMHFTEEAKKTCLRNKLHRALGLPLKF
jgi:hypothetical protein